MECRLAIHTTWMCINVYIGYTRMKRSCDRVLRVPLSVLFTSEHYPDKLPYSARIHCHPLPPVSSFDTLVSILSSVRIEILGNSGLRFFDLTRQFRVTLALTITVNLNEFSITWIEHTSHNWMKFNETIISDSTFGLKWYFKQESRKTNLNSFILTVNLKHWNKIF